MPAHVEERVKASRSTARDDQAFVAERSSEVIAGARNLIGAAGANPAGEKKAIDLGAIEARVGVKAAGQRGVQEFLLFDGRGRSSRPAL